MRGGVRGVMGVLTCGCCGTPVKIVCPNGHDPEPFDIVPDPRHVKAAEAEAPEPAVARPPAPRAPREDPREQPRDHARTYQQKPCAKCHTPFQPSGPRSLFCPACKGA